eukprot:jgi/Botrbrau1/19058/Bobra.0100s0082.1
MPATLQQLNQDGGARNMNVVLKGVPESLEDAGVGALFTGARGLPAISGQIMATRRLGQIPPGTAGRARPVLLRFQSPAARTAAFRYSRHLRPFRLEDDLSAAQRAAPKALQEEFHSLRAMGHSPLWRGATIVLRMGGALHPLVRGTIPHGGPPTDTTRPACVQKGSLCIQKGSLWCSPLSLRAGGLGSTGNFRRGGGGRGLGRTHHTTAGTCEASRRRGGVCRVRQRAGCWLVAVEPASHRC